MLIALGVVFGIMGTSHAGAPPARSVSGLLARPAAAPAPPTAAQVAAARRRIVELNRALRALAPYVRFAPDNTQALLAGRARAAGISASLVDLARQLVAYQNALLRRARLQYVNGSLPSVALAEYPRVRSLFTVASVAAVKQLRAAHQGPVAPNALDLTAPPCGDWATPIPAANPARSLQGPFRDVPATLRRAGFHPTAGYVCGLESPICRGDFTRGHRFSTSAGVCTQSRFRDQAQPSTSLKGYIRVQYGEPNPELASYRWPAWTWGAYVVWWHRNY